MNKDIKATIEEVKHFWQENPLSASANPHPLGTPEYFEFYNGLREKNESIEFSYDLHEYKKFEGKKVLDVGSGNGYVLSKYAKEGAEVFGVDITSAGIELCRKRFELLGLEGDFRIQNAEELPFEDETFDCVCSMGVLHHVPDTEKAVSEIYRVLKKGGRLIVMFYHKDSAHYRVRMKLDTLFKDKDIQQLVNEVDGVGNPKGDVYSRNELKELLKSFDKHEMFTRRLTGWMILPRGGRLVPKFILRLFEKRYGWFLYTKANKR